MSMYIYNLAIRWANGDLEGFGASGLTKESAFNRAVSKADRKAASFSGSTGYDILNKNEYDELSIDEQDELQRDWDNSQL